MRASVLVVDDEPRYRNLFRQVLESAGFEVIEAASAEEAGAVVAAAPPSIIVTDVRMPGASGIDLLRDVRLQHPALPFLLVTAYADVRDAVHAMKLGAVDYISKPVDLDELVVAVRDAVSIASPRSGFKIPPDALAGMIAYSPAMLAVLHDAFRVAGSDVNVLITGESGVGKEVMARFLHDNSVRRNKPMVALNCAAIPGPLLASELFGHLKGSFTGADRKRQGLFMAAGGGTLFLDEIGDMPLELQPALLRAIETGRITPVGSDKEVEADIRLLSATNKNLGEAVKNGRFREDLYYRLNVIALDLPPLRQRVEDILPLARFFLNRGASEARRISRTAASALLAYHWQGNVRELSNAMEHARLLSQSDVITPENLPPHIRAAALRQEEKSGGQAIGGPQGFKTLEETEIENIRMALEKTGGNRTRAAGMLGITRRGLIYKLKRFGLF